MGRKRKRLSTEKAGSRKLGRRRASSTPADPTQAQQSPHGRATDTGPPVAPTSRAELELLKPGAFVLLFAVALAARLAYLSVAKEAELFSGLFLDSRYYAETAASIARGHGAGDHPYLLSPLYPYILALFTNAQGELAVGSVRLLQACAGAATAVCSATIAGRIAGGRAAVVAGLSVALFGPLIHFDAAILVASLQGFSLTLGLALLMHADARETRQESAPRRHLSILGAGLALGFSAALRPTVLALCLLVGTVLIWRLFRTQAARAANGRRLLAFALGCLLPVAPLALRNVLVTGEPILLSANGGVNFWIGNHSAASGVFRLPADYDFAHDPLGKQNAERALGREVSYREASQWWSDRAWQDIRDNPGRSLGLLGKKWLLFFHPQEIPQLGLSFHWHREQAWPLRLPVDARDWLFLALLAPLLLLFSRGPSGVRPVQWPLLFLGAYATAIALFFVTGRYRAPIMPAAIALAAGGLVTLWDVGRGHIQRGRGPCAISAALVLGLGWWSQSLFEGPLSLPTSTGVEERQRGMTLYSEGRYAEAVEAYHRSLQRSDSAITHNNLANALKALGRLDECLAEYKRALELAPLDAATHYNLGNLYRNQLQQPQLAAQLYERATQLQPNMLEAHFNLGAVRIDLGDFEGAIACFRLVQARAPEGHPLLAQCPQALAIAAAGQAQSR